MRNWQIGSARVTQVVEGRGAVPPSFFFEGMTPEQVQVHRWLRPHFAHADGRLFASIHSFVIESEGRRIVVDTCVGNDKPREQPMWDRLQTTFLADLEQAGFATGSIDTVLCTHLHVDHVGWNTRWVNGRWLPTFVNARYLFGRLEYEHWSLAREASTQQVMVDSVQPVIDAGLVQWVETDHALTSEVRLEPTPGHTPGHVSVRIRSQGHEAVITGDLMHHPVQCCEPDRATRFDVDPAMARLTRRRFLAEQADRNVLVLGTHFPEPTGGWVVSAGAAWEFSLAPGLGPK
jgi:glyoxylase-like metal-dependent hydrolase (beta-lactamase superfamily II)